MKLTNVFKQRSNAKKFSSSAIFAVGGVDCGRGNVVAEAAARGRNSTWCN